MRRALRRLSVNVGLTRSKRIGVDLDMTSARSKSATHWMDRMNYTQAAGGNQKRGEIAGAIGIDRLFRLTQMCGPIRASAFTAGNPEDVAFPLIVEHAAQNEK